MSILNIFKKDKKRIEKSHLKQLLYVAMSDGHMDSFENGYFSFIAQKLELTEEDIKMIRENPEKINFTPPSSDKKRFFQLYDMVSMMMVDGDIHEKEMDLCKKLAIKLGYVPKIVDDLIRTISENISQGYTADKILSTLIRSRNNVI